MTQQAAQLSDDPSEGYVTLCLAYFHMIEVASSATTPGEAQNWEWHAREDNTW
jgi:hypothetical protein